MEALHQLENDVDVDVDPYVKSILDGMDSYWEDLAVPLTVSRMVSNSIIKGTVNAIEEEAAERVSLVEAELAVLKRKLQYYERNNSENSQVNVSREVGLVVAQNLVRDLHDEFKAKFSEQHDRISTLTKNWDNMVDEISTMRRDLNDAYRSLFSSEVLVSSHNALESSDECDGSKRKDHSSWKVGGHHLTSEYSSVVKKSEVVGPVINDSPQLKVMTKEQLISYFRTEMTKMKRQHDQALQEKTEELFSLKREILNEKGSSSLHFRKEKDVDLVRKMMLEFMAKIDVILSDKDKLPIPNDNQELSHGLEERIDDFCMEIQGPTSFLADADKTRCAVSQGSSSDSNLVNEIEMLHLAVEEAKMETTIREYVYMTLLSDLVRELEKYEGFELVRKFTEDNYSFIYRTAVGDVLTGINSVVAELYEEKSCINSVVLEKERLLCSEIEENGRLKEEISSLLTLLEVKEKLALDSGAELAHQKEYLNVACHELDRCRDKINDQEIIISNTKREYDLLSFKLEETLQQVQQSEVEISNLKQKFIIVFNALEEAERQKNILCVDTREKQEKLASVLTREKEQKKKLEGIIVSTLELSKAIEDCENRLTECMGKNESRVKMLSYQCNQLIQLVKRQIFSYKKNYERRCQDLQKAETEVDLLGDEVDILLGLLEKIYMALDHYSPVLQHYPGVVETLKLIEKEMKGEHGSKHA